MSSNEKGVDVLRRREGGLGGPKAEDDIVLRLRRDGGVSVANLESKSGKGHGAAGDASSVTT